MVVLMGLAEHAPAEDTVVMRYTVYGFLKESSPNRLVQMSNAYETRDGAQKRLEQIQNDYAPGGTLEYDRDRPIKMRVVEEKVVIPASRPPAPPPQDQGAYIPAPRRPAPEVTKVGGTTWAGWEGARDTPGTTTFQFHKNGSVTAHDNSGAWRGTWRQDGRNVTIQLTQPNSVNYSGQIRGNELSGVARNVQSGGTWKWSVTLK
jgi:hypothetical protein